MSHNLHQEYRSETLKKTVTSTSCNLGSTWQRWDLHVHSPASAGYSGSWEQFEAQLKTAECEVIGVNDYCSIDGYKRIKEKIDKGELDIGNRKILPVVEFRMRDILTNRHSNRAGTSVNFHIIFDDSILPIKIETFLKGLSIDGSQISDRYNDSVYLKEKVKVRFNDDVINVLKNNPDFANKYLVVLPYTDYGGIDDIDPVTDDWIKQDFIRKTHILGTSNKGQISFFLWCSPKKPNGDDKFTSAQFKKWFEVKKPCIKGSDSHTHSYPIGKLADENSQPTSKYCWIKAEASFEGLKQIIYDPESRVFIGEQAPVQPTNTVTSISFNIPTDAKVTVEQSNGIKKQDIFCFAGTNKSYCLSPFFNCFIGGRGTGKTTILNFLGQYANDPTSAFTFWKKIQPSFIRLDPSVFSFEGVEMFEFIGQSEIEDFATNKESFTNAIYERANIASQGALKQQEQVLEELLRKIASFRDIIANLNSLKQDLGDRLKEKKLFENSINFSKSDEYSSLVKEIQETSNEKQSIQSWRTRIHSLWSNLLALKEEFYPAINNDSNSDTVRKDNETVIAYKEAYEKVKALILEAIMLLAEAKTNETSQNERELINKIQNNETVLASLLKSAGLSEENIFQVKNAPQGLVKVEDEINQLNQKIFEAENEIGTYLSTLSNTKNAKVQYEQLITDAIKPLVDTLASQALETNNADIKPIGLSYYFDEMEAWNNTAEIFYQYFSPNYSEGEKPAYLKEYIYDNKNIFSQGWEDIKENLSSIEQVRGYHRFLIRVFTEYANFQIFQTIRDSCLNNVAKFKRIQVLYDGKDIEHASFGQKCTTVIVVLLLFGNYPLVIDEPEAHLDSSLIANYLVPLIKNKKSNRQLIFATHNANFVINGDAEKIFILRNNTGKTEIIETTIEDLRFREDLLKLEGGRDAFKRRGEKLHIK